MPKPKANESRKDFMIRCIPMVIKEGKSREQAIAQCSSTYANKDKYAKWRWWNTCCNHYWIDNIIAVGYYGNDFINYVRDLGNKLGDWFCNSCLCFGKKN